MSENPASSIRCATTSSWRVSRQDPGKTRLINFFRVNDAFHLVDLPGYGFAKAPKAEQEKWGRLMEAYLSSGLLTHIFMLIDIRHAPTAEDKQMFEWILYYGVPFTLIATKADKLARSKRQQAANTAAKLLGAPPYARYPIFRGNRGREAGGGMRAYRCDSCGRHARYVTKHGGKEACAACAGPLFSSFCRVYENRY